MKKLLFVIMICAVASASTFAQGPAANQPNSTPNQQPDAATMLKQMKEKIAPQMVEATGLTLAQAEKVIEINFELRQSMIAYKDLSDEERSKKIADMKVTRNKKYSEIPLTDEQIKSVLSFYENMGKNGPQKPKE